MKSLWHWGAVVSLLAPASFAGTIYIPADQPTIQAGIDAASAGDTVLVAPGIFLENLTFPPFDIVLSGSGIDSTILKPADAHRPLLWIAGHATSATVVQEISFEESDVSSAILVENSSPTICYNRFYRCARAVLPPSVVVADAASAARIHHNLFERNDGPWQTNYQIRADGPSRIYNNTIYSSRYIGVLVNHDSAVVVNNIIIDCAHRGIYTTTNALVDYNLVLYDIYYNLPYGPHGYLFDPMFIDSAAGDFHLWISSPAIDAGHPDYRDTDGTPADLGAFPVAGQPPAAWDIAFDSGSLLPTITWQYADTSAGSSQIGYQIEIGLDRDWTVAEIWASGLVNSGVNSAAYGGSSLQDRDLYYYRIRLQNATGWGSWREGLFAVHVASCQTIEVPARIGTIQEAIFAAADGDTVLIAAGTYIGPFNRDLNFLGKEIVLYAPAGPDSTTLDLGGTPEIQRHAFTFRNDENSNAQVSGLAITNGHGVLGTYYDSPMIKCENAGPVFRNCRIVNNAGTGIGFSTETAMGDTLFITDCEFRGNTGNGVLSEAGAGLVVVESSSFLENGRNGIKTGAATILQAANSLFAGNAGNGVFAWHEMVPRGLYIANCTFAGNATGLWYDWSFPKDQAYSPSSQDSTLTRIVASVFAYNQDYGFRGYAPFDYFVTCNNWFGNGTADAHISNYYPIDSVDNYSLDPLFCDPAAGDYRVADGSVCSAANNACNTAIGAFGLGCTCCRIMGDFDHSGGLIVSDLTSFVNFLFKGGAAPLCPAEMDLNFDSKLSIADLVAVVNLLFRGAIGLTCS